MLSHQIGMRPKLHRTPQGFAKVAAGDKPLCNITGY